MGDNSNHSYHGYHTYHGYHRHHKYGFYHYFFQIKYLFSLCLIFMIYMTNGMLMHSLMSFSELIIIVYTTDLLVRKSRLVGVLFNEIMCLGLNIQLMVLFFGNSYLQTVMLSNLSSLEDLAGKAVAYLTGAGLVLFFSLLPPSRLPSNRKTAVRNDLVLLAYGIIMEAGLLLYAGSSVSPLANYIFLGEQLHQMRTMQASVTEIEMDVDVDEISELFLKSQVRDGRSKDPLLPKNPNVILIFTEGFSKNIMEDERDITPNVSALAKKSISFEGYYNHTFATYRGIIGQLYSGYQLGNLDANKLISVQEILKNAGYHTTFLNTEPDNEDFTRYLNQLGFDEVLGSKEEANIGMLDSYSDKEAYEKLFDIAIDYVQYEQPFFLSMYSFGTHASFDSTEEKFGNGDDPLLNKFHNMDTQFGEFLKKYEESGIANETILVFTADHCTYEDIDFTHAYPDYVRSSSMCDRIPFLIYYPGITPEVIEVPGYNSLDMVPTLLDYMDLSSQNFFLGTSLFEEDHSESMFDQVFVEEAIVFSTKDGNLRQFEETDDLEEKIRQYYIARMKDRSDEDMESVEEIFTSHLDARISPARNNMEIIYTPDSGESYTKMWFAVWSSENGQDDLAWYEANQEENGTWRKIVELKDHTRMGEILIHVYVGEKDPSVCLEGGTVIVG